jgi:hypothetical protein
MKILSKLSLGLLLCEGRFSCVKASKILGLVSHDHLTRQYACQYTFGPVTDWSSLPKTGILVVDSSVIAKPFAQDIEGIRYTYSSLEGGVVLGLDMLLVLWVSQGRHYVLEVILPQGENGNALFRHVLLQVKDAGLEPEKILFDSWFAATETLNLIHKRGWQYVCRVKCNRLFNNMPVKSHDFWGARGKTGRLRGVRHRVQIAKHGERYLLTNDLSPHTSGSLSRVYARRWVIETVFRDLKQVLHLEKCQCRSLTAQFNHILAVLQAYLFLQQAFEGKSTESAHQEFLTQFRAGLIKPQDFLPMAA